MWITTAMPGSRSGYCFLRAAPLPDVAAGGEGFRTAGRRAVARAVDAQLSLGGAAELVGFDRDDVNRVRIVRVHEHREAEVRGDTVGDVAPRVAAVVTAVDPPVVLEEQPLGAGGVLHHLVH